MGCQGWGVIAGGRCVFLDESQERVMVRRGGERCEPYNKGVHSRKRCSIRKTNSRFMPAFNAACIKVAEQIVDLTH